MKRVLCLFYYFPPSGGAGTIRCLAYARELLPHGWLSTVVAPAGPVYHTPGEDLLPAVPAEIRVHRTRNVEARRLFAPLRILGVPSETVARMARAACLPDYQVGWAPFAYGTADRLLRKERFDVLFSSGAPWTAHLVAKRLARRHRLPWVAAFADAWAANPESRMPTPFHQRLQHRWEGAVLAGASGIAVTTPAIGEHLLAAHPGVRAEATVVDNGYNEGDFAGRNAHPADRFTLLYAGTLYPTTAPSDLLKALGILLARHPDWRPLLRVRVMGFCSPEFSSATARQSLSDIVLFEGPRPHAEAVQAMLDAHVLVDARVDHPNAAGQRPVKLFEYLRTGNPVLGFYPEGEAAALLGRFPDCARVKPGEAGAAARTVEAWIARWRKGSWPEPLRRPGIEAYSRAAQVARLARLLDRVAP